MVETIVRAPLSGEQHQKVLTESSVAIWEAINSLHEDGGRVAYERKGFTFEKDGRFTIVKKDGVSVAHMTHQFSQKALLKALIGNAQSNAKWALESFGQNFKESLELPEGYSISHNEEQDLHHIASIGSNNSSIYVGNPELGIYDETQIAAEFRIFFDRPRATVWVSQGPQHSFESTSLLGDTRSAFLYAESYDQLAEKVRDLFHEVTRTPFEEIKVQSAISPRPWA